jgi:hypothetical protein
MVAKNSISQVRKIREIFYDLSVAAHSPISAARPFSWEHGLEARIL